MIWLILLVFFYMLPTLQALSKGHLDTGSICVINLLLGWTLLGWLVALVWSCSGNTRANLERRR